MAAPAADKAAQTIQDLLANPYVQRATHDPAVRDNARVAYSAAREAVDRAKGSDNLLNAIFDDRKLQAELRTLGESVANARGALLAPQKKKRRWGRLLLVTGVGAVLAIALSESLRNKLLDLLFGAEEEFDYVSTTAPPAPAEPAAAPASNGASAEAAPAAETEAPAEPEAAAEPEATEPEGKGGKDA